MHFLKKNVEVTLQVQQLPLGLVMVQPSLLSLVTENSSTENNGIKTEAIYYCGQATGRIRKLVQPWYTQVELTIGQQTANHPSCHSLPYNQ
jgi:hypothetical protein